MGSIDRIVERQIRQAQDRGEFDNLPGAGQPLRNLGGPHDENWWLHQYLMREGVNGVPFLPPALALRKEAEDLPTTVAALPTEAKVRAAVTELNRRILEALKKPAAEGPSMTLMQVDVESVVLGWHAARRPPAPPVVETDPAPAPRRRRFGRRRSVD